jgi:hypothetical protein
MADVLLNPPEGYVELDPLSELTGMRDMPDRLADEMIRLSKGLLKTSHK